MRKILLGTLVAIATGLSLTATAGAATYVFTSNSVISPADNTASASPSSSLAVTVPGLATRVEVQLYGVTHDRAADFDVIIQSPAGQYYWLMSDNCGSDPFALKGWNFADDHPSEMGANSASCAASDYKPSDNSVGVDDLATVLSATPADSFAGLIGTNLTGSWRLFVADDSAGFTGSIANGWEIRIDTTMPDAIRIPATGNQDDIGPLVKNVSGLPRTILDVDVQLNDLTHTHAADLDFALESPAGTKVMFASDGCANTDVLHASWTFDDEAGTPYSNSAETPCLNALQRFSPFNHSNSETGMGSVLSGGPFPSNLSAFDGQLANGDWKLYIDDDGLGDYGFIGGYDLAITIRGAKPQTPSNPAFKFKKLGKKSIRATGRATLAGEALTAGECAGSVKSTFQVKSVRKKGKKKVTSYKTVVAVNSTLTEKSGKCGFDISAMLPKAYSGKSLRLVTNYLGGTYIAPFTRTSTEKIAKIKF